MHLSKYTHITNPENNELVKIDSDAGKIILNNYMGTLRGGMGRPTSNPYSGREFEQKSATWPRTPRLDQTKQYSPPTNTYTPKEYTYSRNYKNPQQSPSSPTRDTMNSNYLYNPHKVNRSSQARNSFTPNLPTYPPTATYTRGASVPPKAQNTRQPQEFVSPPSYMGAPNEFATRQTYNRSVLTNARADEGAPFFQELTDPPGSESEFCTIS